MPGAAENGVHGQLRKDCQEEADNPDPGDSRRH